MGEQQISSDAREAANAAANEFYDAKMKWERGDGDSPGVPDLRAIIAAALAAFAARAAIMKPPLEPLGCPTPGACSCVAAFAARTESARPRDADAREGARTTAYRIVFDTWGARQHTTPAHDDWMRLAELVAVALSQASSAAPSASATRQTDATQKIRKQQHVCTKCGYIVVTQDISEDK